MRSNQRIRCQFASCANGKTNVLTTLRSRVLSALLLTPAIMLLLVWIGRFAGADEVAKIGSVQFVLWAFGVAFGIAATITLYIAYLAKSVCKG